MKNDPMLRLVMSLPDQLEDGARAAGKAIGRKPKPKIQALAVAGMGGSGISGRIAQGLLADKLRIPFLVCNDYELPAVVTARTQFIAISHSGNTEETLAAFDEARKRNCPITVITSGGELGEQAAAHGYQVLSVPGTMPPRAALGYLFSTLVVALESWGVGGFERHGLEEAVTVLRELRNSWLARTAAIARYLVGRLPLVYSTSRALDAVADRWRCQFNENAGVLCHTSSFPEHNHNEIVGMGRPASPGKQTVVLALLDRETHPRTRFRLETVLGITETSYVRALRLESEGNSRLARVLSLILMGDLVSVFLARLSGKDPMEIGRIDALKRQMAEKRG